MCLYLLCRALRDFLPFGLILLDFARCLELGPPPTLAVYPVVDEHPVRHLVYHLGIKEGSNFEGPRPIRNGIMHAPGLLVRNSAKLH